MIPVVHASGGPLRDIVVPVDGLRTGEHIFFTSFFVFPAHALTSNHRFPRERSGEFCPGGARNYGVVGRGTTIYPYASSAVGDGDVFSGSF